MDVTSIIINASIMIFSFGLLVISIASYQRNKNLKLIFISCVFFIFFIKGIIISLSLFFDDVISLQYDPILGVFDLIMLLLLFVATVKR